MSQSDFEAAHSKFKIFLKVFYGLSYLNFAPGSERSVLLSCLKMAILPSVYLFHEVLSVKQIISLIERSFDPIELMYLIILCSCFFQSLSKFLICAVFYKDEFDVLVHYFDKLTITKNILTTVRKNILFKYLKFVYTVAKLYLFRVEIGILAYAVFALTWTNFTLTMFFRYPFAESGSLLDIPLNIIFQIIALHYTVGYMVLIDVLLLFIVFYFRGELDSIASHISNLNSDEKLSDQQYERIISEIHKFHLKTVRKLRIFQQFTWYIHLVQFSTNMIYLSIVIYMIRFADTSFAFALFHQELLHKCSCIAFSDRLLRMVMKVF
uniref:Uncharacterized protein n=1 Tax=Phlebotomus papatasi TaxID=29031 RepID=A0A3F2ZEP6_PHLPP